MGLLDGFFNLSPEQNRGLLAASAALLQAGGPSLRPVSLGQGVASALQAYEQGVQNYQDRQQQQTLYDLKLRGLQGELADQDRLRGRRAAIDVDLQKLRGGASSDDAASSFAGGGMSSPEGVGQPQQMMASAMPGGAMSPKIGGPDWLQAFQQQGGGQAPTALLSPTAPRINQTADLVARQLRVARVYYDNGDIDGANAILEQVQKLRPKVKEWEKVKKDGKVLTQALFDDGTRGDAAGEEVAQNLNWQDVGPETLGLDPTFGFVVARQKNGVTPSAAAANSLGWARLNFDRSHDGDDAASFTPQAIDNAAARYNIDGTLPPMGMGKAGTAGRTKILNRAAELQAGVDPSQQRYNQLNNKGDVGARNAAVRSFATGKDGQAVQSANTALNHLDTIRQLAQAQKSGDVQAFNRAARVLGAQFGEAAPTNLNAALVMVAPEISKAVVGAGGTGHERDQALQALNPNGSPDQILGATATMQELFGGRLTEAKRTYERTTMKKDFDTSMLSPAAQAVLARAQQHANPAGGVAVPPAGGQFSVQAPNGKTFYFKSAKDMNNFKLTAGIR